MKKIFLTILNRPALVAAVSLLVAGAIAITVLPMGNTAPARAFVVASSGSISIAGDVVSGLSMNHLSLGFLTNGRVTEVQVKTGDEVKKGDVLAALDPQNTTGALTQAQAAYAAASAAYQKVVNGATGPAIDVAKATVNTAVVAREQVEKQQDVAVENARMALLNVTPTAHREDSSIQGIETDDVPTITGSYTLGKEGDIIIETYASAARSGLSFHMSGLVTGTESGSAITPQPLGNSGLYITFPEGARANQTWIVSLPNELAPDYITKLNAYQSALQERTQAIATAEAAVRQAESNLNVVLATTRPEDIASANAQVLSAQGALQIAQATYDMRRILAPSDGTVTAVHISIGQTASPNTPAIELSSTSSTKDVAVLVPNSAIIHRDGKTYVQVKNGTGAEEREVTVGIKDSINTEVISGLSAGEEVAVTE